MVLILKNLQSNEQINLIVGTPFIIGRKSVNECYDKRVSRNHGKLTCTLDGKIHFIALHSNPCFYTKNGIPPVVQLNKDEEEILKEGDCLGLLPNSFWFKIVKGKENIIVSENNTMTDITNTLENNCADTIGSVRVKEENNASFISDNTLCNESITSETSTSKPVASSSSCNINLKNKLGDPEFEKTRKLPLWMYEIDGDIDITNPKSSLEVYDSLQKLETEEEPKAKRLKLEEDSGSTSNENPTSAAATIKTLESDNHDIEEPSEIKENMLAETVLKEETVEETSACENNTKSKEGYESDVDLNSLPTTSRRPICQYEGNCYRKNVQHKLDYCHPGDADYVPYEKRPMCQYGASCYRKNQSHKLEYRHPPRNSNESQSATPCSCPSASSPLPAKRRRKTVKEQGVSYLSEDEYDLEDPFINDASSDEFIPSDSDADEGDALEDFIDSESD